MSLVPRGHASRIGWPIRALRVAGLVSLCIAGIPLLPDAVGADLGDDNARAEITAAAHDPAATYVTALVEEAVPHLLATPGPQRVEALHRLFEEHLDLPAIARFAMGRYWRLTEEDERAEFVRLFRELLVQTSNASLEEYRSEKLRITETRPAEGNEVLVRSALGLTDGPAVQIDWRLRREMQRFRIQDVVVEGISVRIVLRDLFATAIREKGGTMAALLAAMRDLLPPSARESR